MTHLDDKTFLSFNGTDCVLLWKLAGKYLSSEKKPKDYFFGGEFFFAGGEYIERLQSIIYLIFQTTASLFAEKSFEDLLQT